MKFATSIKTLVLLAATSLLAACGGGGGSDSDSGFTPPGLSLTTSTSSISTNPRSLVTITATLRRDNAGTVPDGSTVTATVNGAGLGNLSTGNGSNGGTATGTTVGGVVNFYFQTGGNPGSGSITFSAQDTTTPGRTVSRTVNVTVGSGPGNDPRISFTPTKTEIAVNTNNVPFAYGSPYIAEVDVDVRSASGQPLNSENDGEGAIQFSVTPSENGSVSVPDDPDTTEVNEMTSRFSAIFTGIAAGKAKAFVWSRTTPGVITLHAAFTDPDTGQRVEGQYQFNVTSNVPPLPGAVVVTAPAAPIYASDSGGASTGTISVFVTDGAGTAVPNPVSGSNAFNNVRLEILAGAEGDAVLAATDASGVLREGAQIDVRTTNGTANALVRAGVETGTYVIRATADRADNNVDNGIQSAVVGERTIVISDGRLFDIEITQPYVNALLVNPVDETVEPGEDVTVPGSPDGTYSLTVAAIATDRLGNPVIPGTVIRFGLIDEPQATGLGDFLIAGNDGNPQELGTLFTSASGQFLTAGGGVGPGDAIVIFGEEVPGNRDHESARTVATVNSATSLTVTRRFNANDDTGTSVNSGPILPYVVGRAADGNITATGTTNEFGVVRTTMNYPVSKLGKRVIVWAESDADLVAGSAETVTDVEGMVFAGVAPIQISASPGAIPGNTTADVLVCVTDALNAPMMGVTVAFTFTGLTGSGFVDGTAGSGVVAEPTSSDGCTVASVRTVGVSDGGQVVFSVGGASAAVDITVGSLVLQARPSVITTSSALVTLTLLDASGAPQSGFQLVGECTGTNGTTVGLTNGPGVTNAQGQTTVTVNSANLNQVGQAGGGTCTFSTADGSAEATVTIQGVDVCTLGVSPPAPGCDTDPVDTFSLILNLSSTTPGQTGAFSVNSTPAGITCSVAANDTQQCEAEFPEGTEVELTGSINAIAWSGECSEAGAGNTDQVGVVVMNGDRICTATRVAPPVGP